MPDHKRAAAIAEALLSLVEPYHLEHKTRVFFEALPFSRRPDGKLYTRTGAFYLSIYLMRQAGIDVWSMQSKTLKKAFAGTGASDKQGVINAVYNRYGRLENDDNIADAIALATVGNEFIDGKRISIEKIV